MVSGDQYSVEIDRAQEFLQTPTRRKIEMFNRHNNILGVVVMSTNPKAAELESGSVGIDYGMTIRQNGQFAQWYATYEEYDFSRRTLTITRGIVPTHNSSDKYIQGIKKDKEHMIRKFAKDINMTHISPIINMSQDCTTQTFHLTKSADSTARLFVEPESMPLFDSVANQVFMSSNPLQSFNRTRLSANEIRVTNEIKFNPQSVGRRINVDEFPDTVSKSSRPPIFGISQVVYYYKKFRRYRATPSALYIQASVETGGKYRVFTKSIVHPGNMPFDSRLQTDYASLELLNGMNNAVELYYSDYQSNSILNALANLP